MKKKTEFLLSENELKQIIDYVRAEARLSYELKRILWLAQESNKIKNEILKDLPTRFRYKKSDLRRLDKQIYEMIVGKDEIDTNFPQVRLKKNENSK